MYLITETKIMPTKVFLWNAPRSLSSALERSIREIKDSKIFHQPYYRSYHFGPERQSPRYLSLPVELKASYSEIERMLSKEYDGVEILFAKSVAYEVENHFEKVFCKSLREFQHTFIIRNPRKTIPSLYKVCTNQQITGLDYFRPEEAGFRQLYELYHYVQKTFNVNPVVIDADDLLENPKKTLEGNKFLYFTSRILIFLLALTTIFSANTSLTIICLIILH